MFIYSLIRFSLINIFLFHAVVILSNYYFIDYGYMRFGLIIIIIDVPCQLCLYVVL